MLSCVQSRLARAWRIRGGLDRPPHSPRMAIERLLPHVHVAGARLPDRYHVAIGPPDRERAWSPGDELTIVYARGLGQGDRTMALAHAAYHAETFAPGLARACRPGSGGDECQAADRFAAEFLVPPSELRARMRECGMHPAMGEHAPELWIDRIEELEDFFIAPRWAILRQILGLRTLHVKHQICDINFDTSPVDTFERAGVVMRVWAGGIAAHRDKR
jgi:hypothetical protein